MKTMFPGADEDGARVFRTVLAESGTLYGIAWTDDNALVAYADQDTMTNTGLVLIHNGHADHLVEQFITRVRIDG